MAIPFQPENQKVIGRVEKIEEIPSGFDASKSQVKVVLQPVDPRATSLRQFFFPKSASSKGKWMKFLSAYNERRTRTVMGITPAVREEDMLGTWVEVEELVRTGEIQGVPKEWTEPTVSRYFVNEEAARNVWNAENASEGEPAPAPEPEKVEPVPDVVIPIIKQMFAKSGLPVDVFANGDGKALGYTPAQIKSVLS